LLNRALTFHQTQKKIKIKNNQKCIACTSFAKESERRDKLQCVAFEHWPQAKTDENAIAIGDCITH
jgi:uncharacterized CHY-type Zn-finger protein